MRTCSFLVIAGFVAFLAGCAGTSSRAAAVSGPPANVAGSWRGGTIGAGGSTVALVLQQAGSIEVSGRADLTGPLTGDVNGNTVVFRLNSGYGSTNQLNVSGDTITGVVGGSGVTLRRN
jgi:hypothetical protein